MRPHLTEQEYEAIKVLRSNENLLNEVLQKRDETSLQSLNDELLLERQLDNLLPDEIKSDEYFIDLNGYRGRRFIIISDIHLPYQDNLALKAMFKYATKADIDGFILNGDIFDNGELSTHLDFKKRYTFKQELETTKQFFRLLRTLFPEQTIIYKSGNHEEKRLNRKIASDAKEFRDLDCLQLDSLLELNTFNIRYVQERQIMTFGELAILHGHEIGGNSAKAKLAKAQCNIIFGHHHKTDYERVNSLLGKGIEAHMLGCLCKLRPGYMPFNNWNHGFIDIKLNYDLSYVVSVKKINEKYEIV